LHFSVCEEHCPEFGSKTVLNAIGYGVLDVNAINPQHNSDPFGLPYCFSTYILCEPSLTEVMLVAFGLYI